MKIKVNADPIHPTVKKWVSLRKNASQASINEAIKLLQEEWDSDEKSAEDNLPGPYYLELGGTVRWGYSMGFWSWGVGKHHVDREVDVQKEFYSV